MNNPIYLKRGLLAVFSFTLMFAFLGGCTEELAIDVDITKSDTIKVDITQEMYQRYLDSSNTEDSYKIEGKMSTDQADIAEYKERVESLDINEVKVKLANEIEVNNADEFGFSFVDEGNPIDSIGARYTMAQLRTGVTLDLDQGELDRMETSFELGSPINYVLDSKLNGPTKFDLEITVNGTLKVKAKAD